MCYALRSLLHMAVAAIAAPEYGDVSAGKNPTPDMGTPEVQILQRICNLADKVLEPEGSGGNKMFFEADDDGWNILHWAIVGTKEMPRFACVACTYC